MRTEACSLLVYHTHCAIEQAVFSMRNPSSFVHLYIHGQKQHWVCATARRWSSRRRWRSWRRRGRRRAKTCRWRWRLVSWLRSGSPTCCAWASPRRAASFQCAPLWRRREEKSSSRAEHAASAADASRPSPGTCCSGADAASAPFPAPAFI